MTLRDRGDAPVQAPVGGLVLVNVSALALLVLFVLAAPLKSQADRFSQNLFQAIPRTKAPAVVQGNDQGQLSSNDITKIPD